MKVAVVSHHAPADGSTVIRRVYRVVPDDRDPSLPLVDPNSWRVVTIEVSVGTITLDQDDGLLGRLLDLVVDEIRKITTLGVE